MCDYHRHLLLMFLYRKAWKGHFYLWSFSHQLLFPFFIPFFNDVPEQTELLYLSSERMMNLFRSRNFLSRYLFSSRLSVSVKNTISILPLIGSIEIFYSLNSLSFQKIIYCPKTTLFVYCMNVVFTQNP